MNQTVLEDIIALLNHADVGGNTMQRILEETALESQMLKQLVVNAGDLELNNALALRKDWKEEVMSYDEVHEQYKQFAK